MRVINPRWCLVASRSLLIGTMLTLAALLLAVPLVAPLQAQRAELERTIRKRVLPNGLEVIVVPGGGVPIATV